MNRIGIYPEDVLRANQAVGKIDLKQSALVQKLQQAFLDIRTANPSIMEKLAQGGSLRRHEFSVLARTDTSLADGLEEYKQVLHEMTGHDFTQTSIKAYGPRKPGMAAHRDSDQLNADESINAIMPLLGEREVGLWIVPTSFVPIAGPGRRDPQFEPSLAETMAGTMDGELSWVMPFTRFRPKVGEVTIIDETAGVGTWMSGNLGIVALKHSSYPDHGSVSVVCRAYPR